MSYFGVWTGIRIDQRFTTFAYLTDNIKLLDPKPGTWKVPRWYVKAGEGGTWQGAWDDSPLAVKDAAWLAQLVQWGKAEDIKVVPYIVVRGRWDWLQAEHQQIADCARIAGRVCLNVEEGPSFWNGPVAQQELQEGYLWPLEAKLKQEAPRAKVQVTLIPRLWVANALGGLNCIASWLSFADTASWECYGIAADDLKVDQAIPRIKQWADLTGWGRQPRYQVPLVQKSELGTWANTKWAKNGVEVWQLSGD